MPSLTETNILCPYCGESIVALIDEEDMGQEYIEDCQVCCKPILFSVSESIDGSLLISVRDENQTF